MFLHRHRGRCGGEGNRLVVWPLRPPLLCALFAAVSHSAFRVFTSFIETGVVADLEVVGHPCPCFRSPLPPTRLRHLQGGQRRASILRDRRSQVLLFLRFPSSLPQSDLVCIYYHPSSRPAVAPSVTAPFIGFPVALSPDLPILHHPLPFYRLTYVALVDPMTTLHRLRQRLQPLLRRPLRPSRFEHVFGWNFSKSRYLLASPALTAAQKIIRCSTSAEHSFPSAPRSSNCICRDEGPRHSHSPFHRLPCNPPQKLRLHDAAQPSQVPPRMDHLPRPRWG